MILQAALIGAALNRFSGFTNIKWLPGRNIYWAALTLLVISSFTLGWQWGLALFIGALTYRIPGWLKALDMGSYGHSIKRDAIVMFFRGLYFAPPFLWGVVLGANPFVAFTLLGLGSLGATMSYYIGVYYIKIKDPYIFIESAAGACLGIAFALMYTGIV